MKKSIIWLAVSCLIAVSLSVASCAPAVTDDVEVTPPEEAEVVTEEEEEQEEETAPPAPTPIQAPASTATRLERATQTRQDAVEMVLTRAEPDNYYKYGIYAARILAVRHPEIYLQADDLFLEMIETNVGSKKAYETYDVTDDYFIWYFIGGEMSAPPFSLDYVDFTRYQIIKSSELYPEGYPVLPYLDRRILPVASTPKSGGNRLTQLEKAQQYYFASKEKGTAADELYLVYCDNENAYLYDWGNLIGDLLPEK